MGKIYSKEFFQNTDNKSTLHKNIKSGKEEDSKSSEVLQDHLEPNDESSNDQIFHNLPSAKVYSPQNISSQVELEMKIPQRND